MYEIKCKVSSRRDKISGLGKMLKNDPGTLFDAVTCTYYECCVCVGGGMREEKKILRGRKKMGKEIKTGSS